MKERLKHNGMKSMFGRSNQVLLSFLSFLYFLYKKYFIFVKDRGLIWTKNGDQVLNFMQ